MKKTLFASVAILLFAAIGFAEDRGMTLSNSPDPAIIGQNVTITCLATGEWRYDRITKSELTIFNASGVKLVDRALMKIDGKTATYNYAIAAGAKPGTWRFECRVSDGRETETGKRSFNVVSSGTTVNRPPVAKAGGPYTGAAGQPVSFSGTGSSDPDGNPLTYSWNFGDSSTGTGATPTHTYAAAGTFTVTLTVNDGKGGTNSSQTTAVISAKEEYTVLAYDDFEGGWGHFTDGGYDCALYTGDTYAHQEKAAANIQDNSGAASSFYLTKGMDVATPGYTKIKIDFYFYAVSMDSAENFRVQYYDGAAWRTIADYVQGVDFSNNRFYSKTITITDSEYVFPSNMNIRFMCDASSDSDDVYIDEVRISALGDGAPPQNNPPVANAGGPYTGTPGQTVSFSGSGSSDPDGDALTYSWNFGDNSTGTGVSPSHTYAAAGTFTVSLTVNDGKGGTNASQTTATITAASVNHPPVANAGGPYTGTAGQSVSFSGAGSSDPDGDALTYSWNFGDSSTGTGVSPSHTYAAAGTFTVSLTVNDGKGGTNSSQTTATITAASVNHPPVANAGGPYTGTPGQTVSFSGSGSSDPDGDALTYSWNFGDSSTGTGVSPSHTYAAAGTFTVSLTVNDGKGGTNSSQTTATITAVNRPPVANAGGPYTGTPGQAVSFSGSGSSDPDGDTLTYAWNFGDSSTGTGVSPSHTYAAAGTFTVSLTVNDGKGGTNSSQTTAAITAVNRPPVANAGGPYTGTPGQAVSFSGSGSSDPDGDTLTYAWNFGDSSTGTGVSPSHAYAAAGTFTVSLTVNDGKGGTNATQTTATISIAAGGHASIQSYNGPGTCIACHPAEAQEMLNSLHMKWAGPTPELTNTTGEELGKAKGGVNTFCTYAMSSKNACFTCHVRTDGNAPDAPQANDVDCLMCHNDVYQRKFIADPNNTRTVTNILGQVKTYLFGKTDADGNYLSEPDFSKMPVGTTMAGLAQSVHLPTKKSCLRCHAGAGGGDWAKRGDIGVNSANPTVDQDFHMSSAGADLSCADCHAKGNHLIGGRGIDLRATEAPDPNCTDCHSTSPHADTTINRHATGRVACQTCHIQTFGKGGATEMARDWMKPYWNPALCSGQGGFPGEEFKLSNVKPDYRWFDGTSYVYNVGETIAPNADGTYTMAKANGAIFDGKSKIVPIKDHWSIMGLSSDNKIVPPVIMDMFMTGYFDDAIQAGMDEQSMPGSYQVVNTNAELLITHGVDPKTKAPNCATCHASTGKSNLMIPFAELGYHKFLANVESCTKCHSQKTASFTSMHDKHVRDKRLSCTQCHTK